MRKLLLCSVLALPLMGCASGSLSIDPADMHVAVGIGADLYQLGCMVAPKGQSECSRANQHKANKVENAVNGVIDNLPSQ